MCRARNSKALGRADYASVAPSIAICAAVCLVAGCARPNSEPDLGPAATYDEASDIRPELLTIGIDEWSIYMSPWREGRPVEFTVVALDGKILAAHLDRAELEETLPEVYAAIIALETRMGGRLGEPIGPEGLRPYRPTTEVPDQPSTDVKVIFPRPGDGAIICPPVPPH